MIITLDGPAGSGKSTVARQLAIALGGTLLDTGAIYRALALTALRAGVDWGDGPALARLAEGLAIGFRLEGEVNHVFLGGTRVTEAIRTPDISRGASVVSALPEVRRALLLLQRSFAGQGTLVVEGRDAGTVLFPGAALKVFLTADPGVRARRRQRELEAAGHPLDEGQVLREQNARDAADSGRAVAPMCAASDAIMLDTSSLTIEEVVARIRSLIPARPR